MYSFEGDFRRKPQQNLAGASASGKTDRNTLILQLQQQRQKREEQRKRLNSTIKIQAYVRSYLSRMYYKQVERERFDSMFSTASPDDLNLISSLVAKILFFYDDKKDMSRLISLSQLLLKPWKKLFQNTVTYIQIRRLLALHLKLLRSESELPVAVPLRMFEVFTSISSAETTMSHDEAFIAVSNTFLYLVQRGFFQDLRELICSRTPPLYGASPNPPTPLCGALLDLIHRPLQLVCQGSTTKYQDTIMTEFASSYLCDPYPEPVELYVIPALSLDPSKRFPFLALIQCLLHDDKFCSRKLRNDTWLLHSLLALEPPDLAETIRSLDNTILPNNPIMLDYLKILARLTVNVCNKQITYEYEDSLYHDPADDRDDSSDSEEEPNPVSIKEQMLLTRCIELLNEPERCTMVMCSQILENELCVEFLDCMSQICHNLLLSHRSALHKYRLLYMLAFKPTFLRSLWRWLSGLSVDGARGTLLVLLGAGLGAEGGVERLLPPLAAFCALFSLLVGTLHDTEFFKETEGEEDSNVPSDTEANGPGGRVHAFSFSELSALSCALRHACLGLVLRACPDSRPTDHARLTAVWSHLFKVCTHLLRSLHGRDARLKFSARWGWSVAGAVAEPAAAAAALARTTHPHLANTEEGPPLTTREQRTVMILREIPFVVPFATRVLIFQGLLNQERLDNMYDMVNFNEGRSINISVRRTHLYEDAFDKLSPENEPNLKLKLRVQLINQAGAAEEGVDGGGLFREFLSELLKSTFDPNRGLFRLSRDQRLYPAPAVALLYDDFPRHYYFAGRMLGKALYDNLLVELPLAEFFLAKLCSSRDPDVHALASLDPALYRGLLMLKAYRRQDVPDLGLDFTIVTDELGEQRIDELKPGGANIPVTAENRIEYIHLVADYKLNRQIRAQCLSFKRGLMSVVSGGWLRMFSPRELQRLVAGAEVAVDLADLRRHTKYNGGYSDAHPTVVMFWKVVENFTDQERRQLLKFVTSCSRAPLLGFKDLEPPFCIQSAGTADRLPSASTCMNLLKLPEFHSEAQLAEKLRYAIQAGAGFELS